MVLVQYCRYAGRREEKEEGGWEGGKGREGRVGGRGEGKGQEGWEGGKEGREGGWREGEDSPVGEATLEVPALGQ